MRTSIKTLAAAAAAITAASAYSGPAYAGAEPFIGEVMLVGFNWCPRGWAPAAGQLMPIQQYTALFSLYGTIYGGDGRTTFALPDLRGRVPVSQGHGPGLSNVQIGERAGAENVTISTAQMPPHNHTATATSTLHGTSETANQTGAQGGVLASAAGLGGTPLYHAPPANVTLDASSVTTTVTVNNNGGGQPLPVRNPYLGMQWCVALEGIFPPRN
jgi:microcystin-dependent protein